MKPAADRAASLRLIGALVLRPTGFHSGSSGAEAPAALAMSVDEIAVQLCTEMMSVPVDLHIHAKRRVRRK